MRYPVEVRLSQPQARPRMDSLQQVGAESLLRLNLWQLMTTEGLTGKGTDGELHITDLHVCTKPAGAHVIVPLDTLSLTEAERLTATMVRHTLDASVLLADWEIVHCGVKLDETLLGAAPERPDCGGSPLSVEPAPPERPPTPPDVMRQRLVVASLRPSPFPLHAFGFDPADPSGVDESTARLAAGAIQDIAFRATRHVLRDHRSLSLSRLADLDEMGVYGLLPAAYRRRYDASFSNWMVITVIDMAGRLGRLEWTPPANLAEALALHIIIATAQRKILHEKLTAEARVEPAFRALRAFAFDNDDHERLYTSAGDEGLDPVFEHMDVAPGGLVSWFAPGRYGHPYFIAQLGDRPTVFDEAADNDDDYNDAQLRAELDLDPANLFTLTDLAAVGIVEGTWQATSPAVQPEVPISKGDLWRVLCYHRHSAQRWFRSWCAKLGLDANSTVADLAAVHGGDLREPLQAFGGWLTDPTRSLPSGHTIGQLAGTSHGVFCDIVAHNLSTIVEHNRSGGLRHGLLVAAARGGLSRNRYGTPGWPSTVDLVAPMLTEPNHPDWGPHAAAHGGIAALLPVYADNEFSVVRDTLTAKPWRVDSATADCVVTALLTKLAATH
ncbi:hypothetical protein AB0I28_28130 [Phytomonospora sp. NPDC050363]|uniref:hypothetical protein n=1 Tax=Phytomonospora sp. NPDC050363 TaxID=3155642 RepID=UPI0033EFDC1B